MAPAGPGPIGGARASRRAEELGTRGRRRRALPAAGSAVWPPRAATTKVAAPGVARAARDVNDNDSGLAPAPRARRAAH